MTITLFANLRVVGTLPASDPRTAQWDVARYERAVQVVYRGLADTRVGSLVLMQLRRMVTVRPWRVGDATSYALPHNPSGGPWGPRQWAHARVAGESDYYCSDNPQTQGIDETGQPVPNAPTGTGRGIEAEIAFWPRNYPDPVFPRLVPQPGHGNAHPYADLVLVHELVHAVQMTQGADSCFAAPFRYDTFSEFCAITVQNMYASERGYARTDNHQTWEMRADDPLLRRRATPRLRAEAEMLERFRRLMPAFVQSLENVSPTMVRYNPFRELRSWRRLYGPDLRGGLF